MERQRTPWTLEFHWWLIKIWLSPQFHRNVIALIQNLNNSCGIYFDLPTTMKYVRTTHWSYWDTRKPFDHLKFVLLVVIFFYRKTTKKNSSWTAPLYQKVARWTKSERISYIGVQQRDISVWFYSPDVKYIKVKL